MCSCGRWAYDDLRAQWQFCKCSKPFCEEQWPALPPWHCPKPAAVGGKKEATPVQPPLAQDVAAAWASLLATLDEDTRKVVEAAVPGLAKPPTPPKPPDPRQVAQKTFQALAALEAKKEKQEKYLQKLKSELAEAEERLEKTQKEHEEARKAHQDAITVLSQPSPEGPAAEPKGEGGDKDGAGQRAVGSQPAADPAAAAAASQAAGLEDTADDIDMEPEVYKQLKAKLGDEDRVLLDQFQEEMGKACKRQKLQAAEQAAKFQAATAAIGRGLELQAAAARQQAAVQPQLG